MGDEPLPLTRKLAGLVALTRAEAAVLRSFQTNPRRIARHREIVVEGRAYDGLLVLLDGIALRYRLLHDGRRQILDFVLPGDFIGFPGCFFDKALYSISSLSDCTVSPVPFARFPPLFEAHARLAAVIFWSLSCETAMYAEHLTDIGRRSAFERVAHFLLEMLTRLQRIGLAEGNAYRLPLTQELLADALGLSAQYVNQTLRQLREEGLAVVERRRVTILDYERLAAVADFERSYIDRFRCTEFSAVNWSAAAPPAHTA